MNIRAALLCFVTSTAISAAPADTASLQDEAWADERRQEALDAVPQQADFAHAARSLSLAGWTPFSPFPQPVLQNGLVRAFDWASGTWRQTDQQSWLTGRPQWQPIFALTTLNEGSAAPLFPRPWNNLICSPSGARCMIAVTSGGFDEVRWLEIDTASRSVPADAFDLAPSRASLAWLDEDTLLVSHGRESASGYPVEVKRWARGDVLERSPTVFTAGQDVDAVYIDSARLADRSAGLIIAARGTDPVALWAIGRASGEEVRLPTGFPQGSVAGQLAVLVTQDWTHRQRVYPAGSLVSIGLAAIGQGNLPRPEVIFQPPAGSGIGSPKTSSAVLPTEDAFYFTVLRKGGQEVWRALRERGEWRAAPVLAQLGGVASLVAADPAGSTVLASLEGPLTPPALYNLGPQEQAVVQRSPALFDSRRLTVERGFAESRDGTSIPYWLIRPKDASDAAPTILHAYGADGIPLLPGYSADFGKLWLERGGTYVIAQVRGGGEYGRGWQDAGSGERVGSAVEDLIAIADHLVERGVTTPAQLGLFGRSAGGWLVTSAATLRPRLFGAVVSQDGAVDPEAAGPVTGSPVIENQRRLLTTPAGRKVADRYWPVRSFSRGRGCPALLLMSWRGDQRVPAQQSRSLAALHRRAGCPTLLFEQDGGEHGVTSPELLGMTFGFFAGRLGLATIGAVQTAP